MKAFQTQKNNDQSYSTQNRQKENASPTQKLSTEEIQSLNAQIEADRQAYLKELQEKQKAEELKPADPKDIAELNNKAEEIINPKVEVYPSLEEIRKSKPVKKEPAPNLNLMSPSQKMAYMMENNPESINRMEDRIQFNLYVNFKRKSFKRIPASLGQFNSIVSNFNSALSYRNLKFGTIEFRNFRDLVFSDYPHFVKEQLPVSQIKATEEKAPSITSSVGANGKNMPADVILIQERLIDLGLLKKEDLLKHSEGLDNTELSVETEQIQSTIDAIKVLQKEVLGWSKFDGTVDANGTTFKKLQTLNSDIVAQKQQEYQIKQKEEEKANRELETKREKQIEKAKEEKRIQIAKNTPATLPNAKAIIEKYKDSPNEHDKLLKYFALYNPTLTKLAIVKAGAKNDNISVRLCKSLTESELASLDQSLLQQMHNSIKDFSYYTSFAAWLVNPTVGAGLSAMHLEDFKALKKLNRVINVTEKENTLEQDKKIEKKEASDKNKKSIEPVDYSESISKHGESMITEDYYKMNHVYLPIEGKNYKKGDKLTNEDIDEIYKKENVTWCNQFAMDLMEKVLGKNYIEESGEKQGDISATDIYNYLSSSDKFEEIIDDKPFTKAWAEINKGGYVLFVTQGHVATGVKTEKLESRKEVDKDTKETINHYPVVGNIIQAGKSTGNFLMTNGWNIEDFKNIKVYKLK